MKKSYKGAAAAATAGVLLLGGAGSLAYWNATGTVTGGSITSGELKLVAATPAACGDWLLDGGGVFASTSRLVPGDTLTRTCTYTVTASGDHLTADLTVTQPTVSGGNALATALTGNVSGDFTVGGGTVTEITSADDGETLVAVVTVTLPEGSTADNTTQALTASLSDFTVTATQNHS